MTKLYLDEVLAGKVSTPSPFRLSRFNITVAYYKGGFTISIFCCIISVRPRLDNDISRIKSICY